MMDTLTKAQLTALRWFRTQPLGKACMFGKGDPTLAMVMRLHSIGWLETCGRESSRTFGLTYYRLSATGSVVLAKSEAQP